jgi:hypothetical protein
VAAADEDDSSLSELVRFRFFPSPPPPLSGPSPASFFRFPPSLAGLEGAGKANSSVPLPLFAAPLLPLLLPPLPPFCLLLRRFLRGSGSEGVLVHRPRFPRPFPPGSGESVNLRRRKKD